MAQHRHLAAPTYLVAFSLFIIPPFDSMMTVFPFRLGDARWRFGAFGLLSNSLMLSVAGLLIAMLATAVFEHHRFRRVLGVISAMLVVVAASAWIVFALDALQVRNDINPKAALAFKVASGTAATKALVGITTLIALTLAALRGPRTPSSSKSSRGGLIVGSRPVKEVGAAHAAHAGKPHLTAAAEVHQRRELEPSPSELDIESRGPK